METPPQTVVQPRYLPWALSSQTRSEYSIRSRLIMLANLYEPIRLEQMDHVSLLNRVDTKYLLTMDGLYQALETLQHDYFILAVQDSRLNKYRTLYYDTPEFNFYHAHVNERPERYKIRSREYVSSQLAYLEVKHHTRKDRTIKERTPMHWPVEGLSNAQQQWLRLNCPVLSGSQLLPVLCNTFNRITLVSKQSCERVTIDVDLVFYTPSRYFPLHDLVVIEVKTEGNVFASPFIQAMRLQRIHRRGFSKYAMGVALLYDQVKKNALKPKLIWIDKLLSVQVCDE